MRRGSVSQSDSDVIVIVPLVAILDFLSQVNDPELLDTIQVSTGPPHLRVLNSFCRTRQSSAMRCKHVVLY